MFLVKFLSRIILPLVVVSCQSNTINPNAVFEAKYGSEILKRREQNAATIEQRTKIQEEMKPFGAVTERDKSYIESHKGYFPYTDISKFGQKMPVEHFPNGETYQQARSSNPSNSLPPDIFELTYHTTNFPPFQSASREFDTISIPQKDAYGVQTTLAKKPYMILGGKALQKTVENVSVNRTPDDIHNSEIIISEQKQLRRQQKMMEIFGSSDPLQEEAIDQKIEEAQEGDSEKKPDQVAQNMQSDPTKEIMVARQ